MPIANIFQRSIRFRMQNDVSDLLEDLTLDDTSRAEAGSFPACQRLYCQQ